MAGGSFSFEPRSLSRWLLGAGVALVACGGRDISGRAPRATCSSAPTARCIERKAQTSSPSSSCPATAIHGFGACGATPQRKCFSPTKPVTRPSAAETSRSSGGTAGLGTRCSRGLQGRHRRLWIIGCPERVTSRSGGRPRAPRCGRPASQALACGQRGAPTTVGVTVREHSRR